MSLETRLLCGLGALERWLAKDLDARAGLAAAAANSRVEEGILATLLLVKLVERERARRCLAGLYAGDLAADAAHRLQFPNASRKRRPLAALERKERT